MKKFGGSLIVARLGGLDCGLTLENDMIFKGKRLTPIFFGLMMAVGMGNADAAGDAAKGKAVFKKCASCHTYGGGGKRVGGDLKGIVGKKAGTRSGVKYSDAIKNSGIVWSEGKLKAYLASPKKVVPGTAMTFAGIKKEDDVEDLIAYLKKGG